MLSCEQQILITRHCVANYFKKIYKFSSHRHNIMYTIRNYKNYKNNKIVF